MGWAYADQSLEQWDKVDWVVYAISLALFELFLDPSSQCGSALGLTPGDTSEVWRWEGSGHNQAEKAGVGFQGSGVPRRKCWPLLEVTAVAQVRGLKSPPPPALTGAGTGMSSWGEESGLLQVYLVKVEPQRQWDQWDQCTVAECACGSNPRLLPVHIPLSHLPALLASKAKHQTCVGEVMMTSHMAIVNIFSCIIPGSHA